MNLPEIISPSPDASPKDKRAIFFVLAAVACAALIPVCPADYRWVGWALVGWYLLFAALSAIDHWARRRRH